MRWYIFALIGISISAVVGIRYTDAVIGACSQVSSYCMYPIVRVYASFLKPVYDLCGSLECYKDLLAQHQLLHDQYAQLQGKYVALHAQCSYAHDIERELAWFKKRFDVAAAQVVPIMGIHRSDRQHTMLIEGGAARGITRDMVVLADNLLIGKVITVYPWYAVVQLITDPSSYVAVYGVHSGSHGIVRGTGDTQTLLLERVNHLSPVQEHELLLSSGDGMVVPRGYGVGEVESYNSDGLYYTGVVKVLSNIASLKTCLVVERENLLKIS